MNKKGISAVVATVLIILITVAAVAIVWAIVIPMIKDISGGTSCTAAAGSISIKSDFTCIDKLNGEIRVQIERIAPTSGEVDLNDIRIRVHEGGNTSSVEIKDGTLTLSGTILGVNEERVYIIDTVAKGYSGNATGVSLAAMVASGDKEKECPPTNTVALEACATA